MRLRQFERTVLQSVQLDSQIRLEIAVLVKVVSIITEFLLDLFQCRIITGQDDGIIHTQDNNAVMADEET